MKKNLEKWIELIKNQKVNWMQLNKKQPDMNPMVVVERDEKVLAVVIANRLDKHEGLNIALMCRRGFAPDAITLICDAHIAKGEKEDKNFLERWSKPGSMQKACDEEGACKTHEITDCMICTRIENGKIRHFVLPYFYDEKYQGSFHWLDEEIADMNEDDPDVKLSGTIPDTLRKIMAEQTVLEIPEMKKEAEKLELSRERVLYHGGRAIMSVLSLQGHMCMSFDKEPEEAAS